MTLPWTASELLTGQKFQSKRPRVSFKQGKQSYSLTVALQSDADLKITLPDLSATYLVECNFGTVGLDTADITFGWDVTGSASVTRTTQAMALTGTNSNDTQLISSEQSTASWPSGTAIVQAPCAVREKLIVTTTSSAPSTLTLRWCQNSASSTSTSVTDYGWVVAQRLA